MTRILWNSNAPWSSSGYANQTRLFTPKFRDAGYDMALSCFFGLEGGMMEFDGMPCYPTDASRFGALMIGEYAKHHGQGDPSNTLVFTLQDVFTMYTPAFDSIRDLRWVCWTPVDHDPVPPMVTRFLQEASARVVAISEHGQRMFHDADIDALHVPHGLDTSIFKPLPDLRAQFRADLGVPADAYVVGMVANNQGLPSRKAFPQVFEAFARFQKKHSDAILYVHCDVYGRNGGINLIRLAQACGIEPTRMRTSEQTALHLGIPQPMMAGVFNSFDVLCMPSLGEGFGIPLIEAQACGIPVITTDWTAMTELCGAGWLVDGDRWWDETQASWQKVPYVSDIVDALEEAYAHGAGLASAAAAFGARFDADLIMRERWLPVLDEVTRPREIAPLKLAA